ncbi:AsmA-like C-terminal region-containing protein [Gemmata sp. JC717]|uniref:AsmA-like C-terminal region-containing protein n=1 Tax=Gemmata algarum TaxID=2975278 RepID=UPI0021BAA5CB|nr:AsmA-like C-terminal region-containing protein [Gemmata algarum]MDY3556605.1 AsmA-like C-terminal region-containing protein [Gemmata algarum]
MIQPRQGLRWALIGVGGLLAIVVVLRVGLGAYLATGAGKGLVARKISAQIGMPVEVTSVRLGLVTSSIGLKLFDPAAPEGGKSEVFAVEDASADISLFGLATSRISPQQVTLRGVNLTLHVSADGKVVTTLPKVPASSGTGGTLPNIVLADGRLTIRQDGRPEFALHNLNATVTPAGDRVVIDGTMDDPAWSQWTLKGDIAKNGSAGEVRFETPDGPLTMDRLESVPFVPASVWKSIRADGRGAVAVRLWTDSSADVHYAVDIKPNEASLTLPDASVTLAKVTGLINLTGAKIKLVGAKAQLAGGTLAVDGDADFAPEPTLVTLKATAANLDLKQLPPEWKLPRDIDGKLQGSADVSLQVFADGRLVPSGSGEGAITGVEIRLPKGSIKSDDIPIHLRTAGNQLEFQRMPKGTGARPKNAPVRTAARQGKKPAEPPAPKTEAATGGSVLDATVRFRDINIAELLEKLDVKLSYKLSGKVTAEATIAVPVTSAASQSAYKFTGSITSPALTLEGLTVRNLSAKMSYQNGKFALTELVGAIDQPAKGGAAPGTFRGTVNAAIDPPGEVRAALTIDRIPVGEVLKALPGFQLGVQGTASGAVTLTAPYDKISETALWGGSGEISSSELVVEGRTAKDIKLSATVEKGTLTLKEAKVALEGIPIVADGTLGLSGHYPFRATVKTTGTSVTDLRKLVPEVKLPAPVEGVLETDTALTGTISPLTYNATGTMTASKLTLAKSSANHIGLKWALTPERLVVSDLKADAFGGSLTGSADVPFAADKSGSFGVEFKELDAAAATELVPDFPVKIAGKVSGKVGGTIPPAKEGQGRVGNLDVDLSAPKLTVQGIPAERLAGKAALKGGAVEYELEGKTLGGSFEIKGRYPGLKKDDEKAPVGKRDRGSFRLTGADLSRVAGGLGFDALRPLRGRLDVTFDFDNDLSAGNGRITLTRLEWGSNIVSQELIGLLVLRDNILQLSEVRGRIAGGELRARGLVRLEQTQRNYFTVTLTGADAKKLLAPLGADSRDLIDGPVSLMLNARLGSEVRGSGTISLPRGSVSGVPVTDLRVPFTFASAAGGYGRLAIREGTVNAGSGRATAHLTLDWGREARLDGEVRFVDVPIRTIAPSLGENALLGNGRITGRFDLQGSRVRSIDDVNGTLLATLTNTSVREIPILQQVTPFLNTTGLVKPFQSGDVRGSLRGGVFRVQRLALANPSAQLFAEGTITTGGRIDMNVVAHTGTIGPDVPGLRLFGLRLPTFGPIPVTLIRDVSDFLSNRTVRLSITGQTSNPVVKVNIGALLTDQAVRFFLSRYVLPAEAAGVLGLGAGIGSMNSK